MIVNAPLCPFRFCSLLSTDYNNLITEVCNFPLLLERVLAKVDLSPLLSKSLTFVAEGKGGSFVP